MQRQLMNLSMIERVLRDIQKRDLRIVSVVIFSEGINDRS